jgi:hypothetical protein
MSCVQRALRPGIVFVVITTGCWIGSWSRVPVPTPNPLPDTLRSRREVQIWLRDSTSPATWLGVVIGRDSVSGVLPDKNFLGGCSNCWSSPPGGRRIRAPLTEVDSIRVATDNAVTYVVGGGLIVAMVWLLAQPERYWHF